MLPAPDEQALVEALRRRDEGAFVALVARYQTALLRLASMYVRGGGVAEDVVQDTWLGVLKGIDRFEGRSSFKTWLFRILVNRARTRAQREGRLVPISDIEGDEETSVPAERFRPAGMQWAGGWLYPPRAWPSPEEGFLADEVRAQIEAAIESLPGRQREVITLRDIQGLTGEEVCNILELSESNQRVLLHRARSRVRARLERYLDPNEGR